MNATAHTPSASTRLRVLLAALVSFVLVAAGATVSPPAHAAGATVTAAVSSADATGLTVQVQAEGLPDVKGVYAALIVSGAESGVTAGGGYAAFALPFPSVQQGATSFTLKAPVASLDRTKSYEVLVWQQHSAPNASTIFGRGDVAVTAAQWDTVFGTTPVPPSETEPGETTPGETEPGGSGPGETAPGEPEPGETEPATPPTPTPAVATSVMAASEDGGLIVRTAGRDLGTIAGAYVALIEAGTEADVTAAGGFLAMQYVRGISGGAFAVDLTADATALDRSKAYEVIVWQQHTMPSAATIYARSAVTISAAQWEALQPSPAAAAIEVFLADGITPAAGARLHAGDKIVVKGTGYDPTANVGGRGVPIPSDLPQGTYVVFGNFAATWQPSQGAPSSARSVGAQAWALADGVLAQVPAQYQGAIRAQWVDISADGSFQVTLTLKDTAGTPGTYGVYTYAAGGVVNADQERSIALDYRIAPTLTTTVTAATAEDGLTVAAAATKLGTISGAYVALIEKGTEADVTAGGGFLAMQYVRGISGGGFRVDLKTAAKNLDRSKAYEVIVWQQHTMPDADTIHARGAVTITDAQWRALLGEKPNEPKPPVIPAEPAATVPGGSLRWAISSSFTDYITGPIAQGAITVSGGATRSGGQFQFGQTAGGDYDVTTGRGSVVYRGAVRFTGHHGVLDVTVADPMIRITSTSSATLFVTSGGTQVPFATLDLSRAARTAANGAVTYTAVPAALTEAGRDRVLSGYGTTLTPVSFTIGSVAAAPSGSTGTVAAAAVALRAVLPATAPTAAGIEVDEENLAALAAGKTATVSASGFRPDEEGIKVVVYSTPVLLGTVTADASGVATWSGSLPATLADGDHTLTFQGSVDRGLAFTLARATTGIGACTVDGATLHWGFKESFRSYIEGIARGGWSLTDVAYEYPAFVWSHGTGALDDAARTGLITYGGGVTFTGHDGALNTTLANARVELAGDTGYLVFDVTGTTQTGESVAQQGVRLAQFALADAAVADGALTLDAVPATLTPAGASAFGTYEAGAELDPVSAVIPVDGACGTPAEEESAPEAEVDAATTAITATVASEEAPVWPWIVGGLVVVALAATGGVLIVRRTRRGEPAETTTEV